jgi:predicted RNA-binding Zn-ribbon protein involved in translation (DUF1610 family)
METKYYCPRCAAWTTAREEQCHHHTVIVCVVCGEPVTLVQVEPVPVAGATEAT